MRNSFSVTLSAGSSEAASPLSRVNTRRPTTVRPLRWSLLTILAKMWFQVLGLNRHTVRGICGSKQKDCLALLLNAIKHDAKWIKYIRHSDLHWIFVFWFGTWRHADLLSQTTECADVSLECIHLVGTLKKNAPLVNNDINGIYCVLCSWFV